MHMFIGHMDRCNDIDSQNDQKYVLYNLCNPFLVNVIENGISVYHILYMVTTKADLKTELLELAVRT